MQIKQIKKEILDCLKRSNISNPHLESDLIISHVSSFSREDVIKYDEKELSKVEIRNIRKIVKKRISGWPLAYLLGYKYFYNQKFLVNKHTLIPRPESEIIVDHIIKQDFKKEKTTIIDVGTGSGCLIVSLAEALSHHKNNINFWASDISSKALQIAKKNALNYNIKFFKGDLLKPMIGKIENTNIIIIANLPYLTNEEIKQSPSIKKEPRRALYGGSDGLRLYQKLTQDIKKIKKEINITVYQEINDWQAEKLQKIIEKELKNYTVKNETIKDLSDQKRLIVTKIN